MTTTNSVQRMHITQFVRKYIRIYSRQHTCDSNTFIIYTFDTVSNMETHLGKNKKALFIWHEKYIAPFFYALSYRICSRSYSLIYTDLFLLFFFWFFPTWIYSLICTRRGSNRLIYNSMTLDSSTLSLIWTHPGSTWYSLQICALSCRLLRLFTNQLTDYLLID